LLLSALGGVCLQRKSPLRGQDQAKKSVMGSGMLPHGISGSGQDIQYCPVTQFLGQLLRLLVCPNEKFGAQIQKNVKELVAYEMSPALYPILFDQIKIIVEKFFDGQSQVIVNDTNTQVIFPISRSFRQI
jgi:neurofibromin 1